MQFNSTDNESPEQKKPLGKFQSFLRFPSEFLIFWRSIKRKNMSFHWLYLLALQFFEKKLKRRQNTQNSYFPDTQNSAILDVRKIRILLKSYQVRDFLKNFSSQKLRTMKRNIFYLYLSCKKSKTRSENAKTAPIS